VGSFGPVTLIWTPSQNWPGSSVTVRVGGTNVLYNNTAQTPVSPIYIDSISLFVAVPTLIDRRGFVRTKILSVGGALTLTSGNRIGDLYLAAHRTVPFKGGFRVVGQGGVRRVVGGASVHPAHLQGGQLVRCSHRIDPDTGAWGREGTIASIQYDHDSLTSTVSLDENREGFEALLSRLAVVQGQ
jgi:hypothetical protein